MIKRIDDYYEAKITIDVGGGLIKEIDLSLTLIPVSGQQIESPFYIHMYLDDSNVGVYPWAETMVPATNIGPGVWSYYIDGIKPGKYTVAVDTDVDKNSELCGFGEVCGLFVDDEGNDVLDITLDGVTGADIEPVLIISQ